LNQDFRGRGRPWGLFFGFYKTRHILLSDSANCTVLRAVVLTQYRRVTDRQTDGQTDGIAVTSTALASIAARCKNHHSKSHRPCTSRKDVDKQPTSWLLLICSFKFRSAFSCGRLVSLSVLLPKKETLFIL